jgi:putative mRNA 3-end processing factor
VVISFTDKGLYCAAGDFYIDPWQPVDYAVITHAHSDHARWGNKHYLAHPDSAPVLKARLGADISVQTLPYGVPLQIHNAEVTFFPAGHVIGSAQVRVTVNGETWVVSGDYKLEDDGFCTAFEPVQCHTFITESTFGLPIYQWEPQAVVMENIHQWVQQNQSLGRNSILSAYSLGKAQRIINALSPYGYRFYVHGAIYRMHEVIKQYTGLPDVTYLNASVPQDEVKKGIIIVPPSAVNTSWMRRWQPYMLGICSGWMQVRGVQRRRNADAGFALSDHADWPGLLKAVAATGAERVYVTHGFTSTLARYLREETGITADIVKTAFGTEDEENEAIDEPVN